MTRQAIIVFAVLLGAGLAGLLWYQLTRAPADQVVVVTSPTPVASQAPVATTTLAATVTPETVQLGKNEQGQPTVTSETTQAPVPVSNTAPTGFDEAALLLTGLATLAGGYGLRRSLQGSNF